MLSAFEVSFRHQTLARPNWRSVTPKRSRVKTESGDCSQDRETQHEYIVLELNLTVPVGARQCQLIRKNRNIRLAPSTNARLDQASRNDNERQVTRKSHSPTCAIPHSSQPPCHSATSKRPRHHHHHHLHEHTSNNPYHSLPSSEQPLSPRLPTTMTNTTTHHCSLNTTKRQHRQTNQLHQSPSTTTALHHSTTKALPHTALNPHRHHHHHHQRPLHHQAPPPPALKPSTITIPYPTTKAPPPPKPLRHQH
nr:uncharacterized histidine-rich protein DDB_G0274557-like [Penaeus vannamei]